MAMERSPDFKLESMRLSFPNLLKPQKMEENGVVKLKYNGTFLWPKTAGGLGLFGIDGQKNKIDVADLALKTAVAQWGDKAAEWIKNGTIKTPFLDGDGPQGASKKTGERHAGYAGHRFIRAGANEDRQPQLFTNRKGSDGKLVPVTEADQLYPGCFVNVVVNLYCWEHTKNGKGLSFGLNMVQFAKDGERLGGGGSSASDFFDGIEDTGEAPAATQGGEGAAGLFS